ncbi:MAG: VWA domain-containing protein [Acidobacteriota bacterium]|nr:VWA domain-containing protein [Acidobacteriota bacterium]
MRWRRATIAVICLGTALCLTAFRHGAAQQEAGSTTTLQVYSRLTVIDVTATDADGQPVYGLKQSDFSILEDGKPQPIRNFEEVGVKPVMPPPNLPPNVYTNLQPPAPSSAVNILLLDMANEAPEDSTNPPEVSAATELQRRVKLAAKDALEQMPPGTQVAVLSMTNNLRILQSFTSNRALLEAAIDATPYDLNGNGDKQCVQSNNRNRTVLEALDQIAVSSAAIHGRKNLIWFTVGIPAITDPNERPQCLPDYALGLSHAYDQLTAAQVSVYPIDAQGARILGPAQLSMQAVAEATGGVAYIENNDMATAVLKAINNGANYYSIAYTPPDKKYNGAYHKIEARVDKPGVQLVFRKGYYSDDLAKDKLPAGLTFSMAPPPAYAGNMKAPMSRGMATSQQILFDVEVEPSKLATKPGDPPVLGTLAQNLQGKRLARYAFSYSIPAQQIDFKPGSNNMHNASLDFDIAVYDANDHLLTGLSQIFKASVSDATYQQLTTREPIRFIQQIDLPPGQLFVRVGVLDHTTNKTGTLELPLKIGKQ